MMSDKFFWNRFADWKIEDGVLYIDENQYKGQVVELLPEIYKKALYGCTVEELNHLSDGGKINPRATKLFIQELIRKEILRNKLTRTNDLFRHEAKFVPSDYSEEFFFNRENVEKFRMDRLERFQQRDSGSDGVMLHKNAELPEYLKKRHSVRKFDTEREVTFEDFSGVFQAFSQDVERNRYLYPSAGGLYPINIYVYVKEGRVEHVAGGLYLYNPSDSKLEVVDKHCKIDEGSQLFTNKEIFKTSAFTVYFTYDGEVNIPKYGGDGYYYGILDSGIMVGLLNFISEYFHLSSCSIGKMNFEKIEQYFKLKENEVYLHSVEVGYEAQE